MKRLRDILGSQIVKIADMSCLSGDSISMTVILFVNVTVGTFVERVLVVSRLIETAFYSKNPVKILYTV